MSATAPGLRFDPIGGEYNEGILRGAPVELKKGKLKSHQFTAR